MPSSECLNLVVLGAAQIFGRSYQCFGNTGQHIRLYGVASRELERAEEFIRHHQGRYPITPAPRAYGSYEEALADPAVGAVYVPLPTRRRKTWVVAAAEAGKHVLTEKPGGGDADEVREMLAACRKAGVQFMDNTMLMHSQRRPEFESQLRTIGNIKNIVARFSFLADEGFLAEDIRLNSDLELGCAGDLSWYNIRAILLARNWLMPASVRSRCIEEAGIPDSPGRVSATFESTFQYADGCTAYEYSSFKSAFCQRLEVLGTEGQLLLDDFVLPYLDGEVAFTVSQPVFTEDGQVERHDQRVAVSERSQGQSNSQDTRLLNKFAELALSGQPDESWGQATLRTQIVLDACLESARRGEAVEISDAD